jgi:hypothetical protein
MNRSFDEQISREHFVVRVQHIDVDGIWGTHPYNEEMVSFYSMSHVISIHEEIELNPNNPEHAALIKQYEQRTGQKAQSDLRKAPEPEKKQGGCGGNCSCGTKEKPPAPPPVEETDGNATFVDIDHLEQLAEHTKRTFDAETLLN